MNAAAAAGIGVGLVLMLLLFRWKWRSMKTFSHSEQDCPPCTPLHLVHRLCPHNNVVQRYEVEQKDSLDEHLDVLSRKLAEKHYDVDQKNSFDENYDMLASKLSKNTCKQEQDCPLCTSARLMHRPCPYNDAVQRYDRDVERKDSLEAYFDVTCRKIAEKEGRLRMSKMKIRETQNEIDNLHAIDINVRMKYRQLMDSLKNDLSSNEKECKKIQEQIEWVSRRRAELKVEVCQGQRLFGEAAAELASNLAELQRGRTDHHVIEKPYDSSNMSLRHRKEPQLPRSSVGSILIKSPPSSPPLQTNKCYQMPDRENA